MQNLNLPRKHPYQYLNQHFTLEDLQFLCQGLGIQYENLRGDTKQSKALDLQSLMSRNLQLGTLLADIPMYKSAGYNPEDYIYLLIEDHIDAQQISSICQTLALPCQELTLSPQDLMAYDHNNRFRRGKAQILHAYAVQENRQKELLEAMQKLSPTLNLQAFTQAPPAMPATQPATSPPASKPRSKAVAYENFDLRIGHKREEDGKYPIEVLASPNGQVNPVWHDFPVDDPEFFSLTTYLENLVARGSDAKKLGQKMYEMLFPGSIGSKYIECVTSTKMDGKGLRLRLRVDPPELDRWPWEYCFHPQYDYIAQNKMTPFVRYPSESIAVGSLKMPKPLHVLFVSANPTGTAVINPERERQVVETALEPLIATGQVVLDVLEAPASAENLDMKIQDGNYDILHYFGHGIVLDDGQGALALEDEFDNSLQPLDVDQMRAIFRNSSLKVAFLNACRVGGHEGEDPMNSIGRSLMRAGVPVVVAMQFELPQKTAHLFSRRLYTSLAKGEPFDQAISTIRRSAFISTRDKIYWGIPILTMRAEDGIF